MKIVRAVIVAFTALAIGALPNASASVHAGSSGASLVLTSPDCCPEGRDCDQQRNCAKLAGCELKCSSSAWSTPPAETALTRLSHSSQTALPAEALVRNSAHNPPLPPPRV
jgi:hypothetical protein